MSSGEPVLTQLVVEGREPRVHVCGQRVDAERVAIGLDRAREVPTRLQERGTLDVQACVIRIEEDRSIELVHRVGRPALEVCEDPRSLPDHAY